MNVSKFAILAMTAGAALAAAASAVNYSPELLHKEVEGLTLPEPYEPKVPNQLLTLGKAEKPRFEVKDISWPAKPGDAEVCLWKDDKVAALSLTIDDNCEPDHDWWLEQCKKHGFKVTFFVIAGAIDRNTGFFGKWSGWRAFASNGCVSVQSHSLNHQRHDDTRDAEEVRLEYAGSRALIDKNLPAQRCLALAYPNGKGNRDLAARYFIACRGTVGTPNPANQINYLWVNIGQLTEPGFEVMTTGKTSGEPKWLNRRLYYRGWCATLCHSVHYGKTPADRDAAAAKMAAVLDCLASYSDRIWEDFFVDVAKYGQERDSATLKTVSASAAKIELSLTDLMRDDIFDYPLTLKVRLPDGWTTAAAKQGGKPVAAKFVKHDGASYALVDAVPDRGPVTVTTR